MLTIRQDKSEGDDDAHHERDDEGKPPAVPQRTLGDLHAATLAETLVTVPWFPPPGEPQTNKSRRRNGTTPATITTTASAASIPYPAQSAP